MQFCGAAQLHPQGVGKPHGDGSEVERVVFDARFALSPVVGVWTGTAVSHWVKEYSQSERKTDYETLMTKAQPFRVVRKHILLPIV
eukprot:9847614-Lingulodinium_polyedra.AAC.1